MKSGELESFIVVLIFLIPMTITLYMMHRSIYGRVQDPTKKVKS